MINLKGKFGIDWSKKELVSGHPLSDEVARRVEVLTSLIIVVDQYFAFFHRSFGEN